MPRKRIFVSNTRAVAEHWRFGIGRAAGIAFSAPESIQNGGGTFMPRRR
ncbi:TPA: hypothetical protein WI109_001674, partial [Neisseria meningitidis]